MNFTDAIIVDNIFTPKECVDMFNYLNNEIDIEYRKQYKGMYGRTVSVPRGQASFTLNDTIHYNYKVAGGSPPNLVMSDTLKTITKRINEKLNTNFNTILMNVYKDGNDCISFHKDKETGWVKDTGFATLSLGAERDFVLKKVDTGEIEKILHTNGLTIYMPSPMNSYFLHGVPKRTKIKDTRISLTFREIL